MELAAVYAVAEFYRNRGGGLLIRQPGEEIAFISKLSYPLWLVPRGDSVLVFDGLAESEYTISYLEAQSALAFLKKLEANIEPRDKFAVFLSDNISYFLQLPAEKQFTLKGILANIDFRVDISNYLKEATEKNSAVPALTPILWYSEISRTLDEMNKLQSYLEIDLDALSKIAQVINKTFAQYFSEIDFQTTAAMDEKDAKIKAHKEFIAPQVAQLKKEYKAKTKELATRYDHDLVDLNNLKKKTLKYIYKKRSECRKFEHEAKIQARLGHEISERKWKEKVNESRKELWELRKEYRRLEESINHCSKEKGQAIAQLNYELEDKIKYLSEPIAGLQQAFEEKKTVFKQQAERLVNLQNVILENLALGQKQRQTAKDGVDGLGIDSPPFEVPALVYVPFYLVCYEALNARRYLCLSPSNVENVDLSARFKGVLGMSKIKDLLTPRFTSLVGIIGKVEAYCRARPSFEEYTHELGAQNNLLIETEFGDSIISGLSLLRDWGWLSARENSKLRSRFTS